MGSRVALKSSLIIGLAIAATFQYQAQEAKDRVYHTYLVKNQAQELLTQVLTTEVVVKDYGLTGQKKYLDSHEKATKNLLISLDEMRDLVKDNPISNNNFPPKSPIIKIF